MTKRRKRTAQKQNEPLNVDSAGLVQSEEKKQTIILLSICLILFVFGAYQSILFYGHQVVPNGDFMGFHASGKAILSFNLPPSFKRAPVTGMLQCLLKPLVSGDYSHLKAGWLANAILHPFNGILLFLLARQLIGNGAKWFALLCLLNPWVLYLMTEPIAETTLLFFLLLTVLLIFRQSKWAYLAASVASMVRYECAALIFAAFLMDMILGQSKKDRIQALLFSCIASIPLGLWMLGTRATAGQNQLHYLNIFKEVFTGSLGQENKDSVGFVKHLEIIWSVGYKNLTAVSLSDGKEIAPAVVLLNKVIAATTFILGCGMAIVRKSWKILVLVIFLFPYFLIHAYYPFPIPRFHMPSFWIALLISLYGLSEGWKWIAGKVTIPKTVIIFLQVILSVTFFAWCSAIVSNLKYCNNICPKASAMPWIAMGALLALGVVTYLFQRKETLREITVLSMMSMAIIANHVNVAWLLNTGTRDAEFKLLADWCNDNLQEDEKLATSMASVVNLYLPYRIQKNITSFRTVKGEDLLDFAVKLQEQDITYIAWDLRIESIRKEAYYRLSHLEHLRPLAQAKDIGPYKFVTQMKNGKRFVNVFRIEDADKYRWEKPDSEKPGPNAK